ncbi:aminotransferase class I/II-fold pyridoxal phosphate-dependent enzyme, partial [Streptomyces roseolus]|uniref:aminotransferase class I/II-fold pyridoxal phosphate-dependent enzyme n=1 Tax=Streptomyces roseolus TaxID=67358 RepID=UPI00366576F5
VCGGSYEGIVAVHSLSKRSNLAGYRAAFIAGDAAVLGELLQIRKHGGMMTAAPVQAATVAALGDDAHVAEQRARYAARREVLKAALEAHGFRIEHSEASLYLWATRDEPCWETVAYLAEKGVLVAPGDFYGEVLTPSASRTAGVRATQEAMPTPATSMKTKRAARQRRVAWSSTAESSADTGRERTVVRPRSV